MSHPTRKLLLRGLLFALAAVLLTAAVAAAVTQVDWPRLEDVPPGHALLLAGCVVANLLLTGAMLWVVTLSFDASPRVSFWRMSWLVMLSALLNYLPLRPGLLGRAAILRTHHQLPVRQSILSLLVVLVTGCVTTLTVGTLAWLIVEPLLLAVSLVAATGLLAAVSGWIGSRLLRRPVVMAWLWIPLRAADALVAGCRLWLAFEILGVGVDYREALVAGAAGVLVAMVGLTPNGLGLREWVIALLASALDATAWETGLAASLVDRGVEAIIVVLLGLVAIAMLRPLWRTASPIPSRDLPLDDLPPRYLPKED